MPTGYLLGTRVIPGIGHFPTSVGVGNHLSFYLSQPASQEDSCNRRSQMEISDGQQPIGVIDCRRHMDISIRVDTTPRLLRLTWSPLSVAFRAKG